MEMGGLTNNTTDAEDGPVSWICIKIDLNEERLFTLRLFLKTQLITIQGNRHNDSCDWEFPVSKQADDSLNKYESDETVSKELLGSCSDSNINVATLVPYAGLSGGLSSIWLMFCFSGRVTPVLSVDID